MSGKRWGTRGTTQAFSTRSQCLRFSRDARTVNVIASAAHHKSSRIVLAVLKVGASILEHGWDVGPPFPSHLHLFTLSPSSSSWVKMRPTRQARLCDGGV